VYLFVLVAAVAQSAYSAPC